MVQHRIRRARPLRHRLRVDPKHGTRPLAVPCDCNAPQFPRTIVFAARRSTLEHVRSKHGGTTDRGIRRTDTRHFQGEDDMQRSTPTACHAFPAPDDPMSELRALDEMERLALTQVAAARQRKREILLKHGIPIARRTTAKILVMPSVAPPEG